MWEAVRISGKLPVFDALNLIGVGRLAGTMRLIP